MDKKMNPRSQIPDRGPRSGVWYLNSCTCGLYRLSSALCVLDNFVSDRGTVRRMDPRKVQSVFEEGTRSLSVLCHVSRKMYPGI